LHFYAVIDYPQSGVVCNFGRFSVCLLVCLYVCLSGNFRKPDAYEYNRVMALIRGWSYRRLEGILANV